MELSPFRIERFYARYEHSTRFMLSSSDCESRTIGALLELEPEAHGRLLETCASAPSEFLTALALRHRQVLLDRNLAIVRRNLPLLDGFFERHAGTFAWIRPTASPIGFPRVTGFGDLTRFCEQLAEAGVLLLPGSVYDQPGHVRVGFGRANMPDALDLLEANLTNGQRRPRDAPDGSAPRAGRD